MIYRLGWAIWWCALGIGAMCVLLAGFGYFANGIDLANTVSLAAIGLLIVGGGRLVRYVISGD